MHIFNTFFVQFHSDMVDLFMSLNMPRMARKQERQLTEEMRNHIKTKEYLLKSTGTLMQVSPTTNKKILPAIPKNMPTSELACKPIIKEALEAWKRWETSTVEMYQSMTKEEASRWWKIMLHGAECELEKIVRELKRLN